MPSNSMNVITYNRNLLPQRDKFKNRLCGYDPDKKTAYNLPKATSKQLREIRNRLREEHKSRMLTVVIVTLIVSLLIIFVCLYASEGAYHLIMG